MGANGSMPLPSKPALAKSPFRSNSQYTSALNTNYIPDPNATFKSSSTSSESEESDETLAKLKKEVKPSAEGKQNEDVRAVEAVKSLEGLGYDEKVKKSEEMLRQLWKHPHASWQTITEVTKMQKERTSVEMQVDEEVEKEVKHDIDKVIFDVPLENCHLKVTNNRVLRSCPDPWRRHGAYVKICEIGGTIPENKAKNARNVMIRKGTQPPPAPISKPLTTVDDYMRIVKR